jgi:hypothetical protein
LLALLVLTLSNPSFAQTTRNASMGGEVVSDFKYLTNNALLDVAGSCAAFEKLRVQRCPFADLPNRSEGCWGEGLTAAKMGIGWSRSSSRESSSWSGRPRIDCVTPA